jgi:hypothetical protein
MSKRTIFFTLLIFSLISCKTSDHDVLSDKIEFFFSSITESNIEDTEYLLVVPIDKGCGFCVSKVVEFARVFEIPENLRIVFSSGDKTVLNNFLTENSLKNKKHVILDSKNYFFLNELIFLKPTIFQKSDNEWTPIELVPVNVEDLLFEHFVNLPSRPHLQEFYDFVASGEVSEIEEQGNKVFLRFKSSMGFGIDSSLNIDKSVYEGFGSSLVEGSLILKEPRSFYFFEYLLLDSMSARAFRKVAEFND